MIPMYISPRPTSSATPSAPTTGWSLRHGRRPDVPILANDPHREHSVPSLRYIVGLNAPGISVIGAGEPALPGISIGHNDTIAFGLTIFNVDQEDLYVYELNPADLNQYRYGGGWEDRCASSMKAEQVKGEGDKRLRAEVHAARARRLCR